MYRTQFANSLGTLYACKEVWWKYIVRDHWVLQLGSSPFQACQETTVLGFLYFPAIYTMIFYCKTDGSFIIRHSHRNLCHCQRHAQRWREWQLHGRACVPLTFISNSQARDTHSQYSPIYCLWFPGFSHSVFLSLALLWRKHWENYFREHRSKLSSKAWAWIQTESL